MTAIEEMAGMDVLCSDKTGTLTLNKLTVDKSLIEVVTLFHTCHLIASTEMMINMDEFPYQYFPDTDSIFLYNFLDPL